MQDVNKSFSSICKILSTSNGGLENRCCVDQLGAPACVQFTGKLTFLSSLNIFVVKAIDLSYQEKQIVYFSNREPTSLDKTLEKVKETAEKVGIKSIVVASTSGETGVKAVKMLNDYNVVVVAHHSGYREPNANELTEDNRNKILANGGKILTTTHALGAVGRAIRTKFNTMQADEIIANTLRIFGEGMKVAVEIALMAGDAGLIRTDEDVISVGKWDTAVVLRPANVTNFFDLKVKEVLCKPRL